MGGDGVMYSIGPFDLLDNTPEGREKRRSGSNIRIVKPGSLIDNGSEQGTGSVHIFH